MKFYKAILFLFICTFSLTCKYSEQSKSKSFDMYYESFEKKQFQTKDSLQKNIAFIDANWHEASDERWQWLYYFTQGLIQIKENNYEKAILYEIKAIEIAKRLNIETLLLRSYNTIGVAYAETGKTDEAFRNYQMALDIATKNNDKKNMARVQLNLARLYFYKGDLELMRPAINKVLEYDNDELKLMASHTLANYFGSQNFIDSALLIDNTTIAANEGKINALHLSPFYNNKALCKLAKEQLDSSIFFLQKSYELDSINNVPRNMAANLNIMANVYFDQGNFKEALNTSNRALAIFRRVHSQKNILETYLQISSFYKDEKDYKNAMLYQDSSNFVKNQIAGPEVNAKMDAIRIDSEILKKNSIIKEQSNKLRFQKIALTLISILGAFALALFYFISKNIKAKRKYQQQQILFDAANEAESIERERISQDLHDSAGQKLAVVKMQLSVNHDTEKTMDLLDDAIKDIRAITHNLIPPDLNFGIVPAIKKLCANINYGSVAPKVRFVAANEVNELGISDHRSLFIYRIIQELLTNSLKYADAKEIHIELAIVKNYIQIKFTDDGKGFDTGLIETSQGIGIRNIKKRLEQLDGQIEIISNKDRGTQFMIEIPI